jgi:hypothetical protein
MFLLTFIFSYSQTFHSELQVDAVNNLNYTHGVMRETVTFTIDLIKLKFSITSSFLSLQNLDLILLDARFDMDDNVQFKKSKYEIQNKGNSLGMYLYIEDHKDVKDELIVGKYNKGFTIELIKDGKQTSLLGCYIKELDLPIKYDPKTLWCQYQPYISNYRVESTGESEQGDIKRTKILIEIDSINHYFSINDQQRHKLTFIEKGEKEFLGNWWKFIKYRNEDYQSEFLTIYETDKPYNIGNSQYLKIFNFLTMDTSTNKKTSSTDLYISNSPDNDEDQNDNNTEEVPN